MSPTLLRWSAIPVGVLAFGGRLVDTFWWQPVTWRMSPVSGVLAMLGGLLVAAVVPFGMFALLCRGGRPARFIVGDGRFAVAPSPIYSGSQTIVLMFLSAGLVVTERVPNGDSMRMAEFGFAWPVSIVGVGLFWTGAVVLLLVQRPQLHLDPNGLTLRRVRRTTQLAWDHLAPGGPVPPAKRQQRHLTVYLNTPPVAGTRPSEDLPIGLLHIDPTFLAGTVRHYVEHPADRAAIGSVEELARLRHSADVSVDGRSRGAMPR